MVPDDIMGEIKDYLFDRPEWLISIIDEKDKSLEQLRRDINDIAEDRDAAFSEAERLRTQLEEELAKPEGISASDTRKLVALGVGSISELINNYRLLQIQAEEEKDNRAGSVISSRTSSTATYNLKQREECQRPQKTIAKGGSTFIAKHGDSVGISARAVVPIPFPDKFVGKTRIELERWLRYFDRAVDSRGFTDGDKITVLGNYIPTLQFVHDKLMRNRASYEEAKAELLNSLGSDSSVATFTLRTSLDRLKKPDNKLYKHILEDIERK
uniref:Uncharacterized protein n=1 Tax=Panagrolaimus sp. ES5 TaxID=591445 RepID=A0AC34GHA9_9BILA